MFPWNGSMLNSKVRRKEKQKNEKQSTHGAEMLREDSVVIHDVGFPDEAYHSVKGNVQAKPEPSPSIFQDDVDLYAELFIILATTQCAYSKLL